MHFWFHGSDLSKIYNPKNNYILHRQIVEQKILNVVSWRVAAPTIMPSYSHTAVLCSTAAAPAEVVGVFIVIGLLFHIFNSGLTN